MTQTEQTACILCSRNCGLRVETAGGRIGAVRGDDAHPVSKGYICQKAARLTHYQDHADRLEFPLRREPDGSFVRVSWEAALSDIASRLTALRSAHGGRAFAFYGGGGQGNHLGGAYSRQLMKAMKSRFVYSALAQEKTGDFWVNGRLFGDQRCHTTEDVEHADFVMFIGTNPFQAHGIPNARDTLRDLKKSASRTMVVVDPRKTETARQADIHLQPRPSTDAFLIAAMLAIIVREGLHDRAFLRHRCTGFPAVEAALRAIPVEEFVRRADVPLADVERVARAFAAAKSACVRIDLGIQQSLHSTLNSYLEKLLFLVTGNFGKRGANNFHSSLLPILGHTDERDDRHPRTARHGMFPISGLYPPNILPSEIEHDGEDRLRAMWVDSANPVLTGADTAAYERAFRKLDLLVVVDVAMTETARLAHYVLPAASQFEKWECTGFNLEFPDNAFQLRHPLFPLRGEASPSPKSTPASSSRWARSRTNSRSSSASPGPSPPSPPTPPSSQPWPRPSQRSLAGPLSLPRSRTAPSVVPSQPPARSPTVSPPPPPPPCSLSPWGWPPRTLAPCAPPATAATASPSARTSFKPSSTGPKARCSRAIATRTHGLSSSTRTVASTSKSRRCSRPFKP
ncbi:MAG: molybdopterin-dependent oxidoreductase [Polyangiaceae bacterium]